MLRLLQFVKKSFAPINRIPPEVLSLIPDHHIEDDTDKTLIALTHVCRYWRNIFISRPSLWTRLDFKNIDKTRTYIQRSQSFPLKLILGYYEVSDDVFGPMVPHVHRLKSLTIDTKRLPRVLQHFRCPTPLLEKLNIRIDVPYGVTLDGTLFNGDLSSLHELHLGGVITDLPWKNLANLRVVHLEYSSRSYRMTQILDFFESAPLLHTVSLGYPMPSSSDAPPGRIVPLRHLKVFSINTNPPHSILLHHLRIPLGASLISQFHYREVESPLLDYLPKITPNFNNLSHITTVNLLFGQGRGYVLLSGPSGSLRMLVGWGGWGIHTLDERPRRILHSLGHPALSTVQRLKILEYSHPKPAEGGECPIFQALSSLNNLRTLVVINCNNRPFTCALDPGQNPSNLPLCSKMEELVFYIKFWYPIDIQLLIRMAKNRASRGAKLPSITFVDRSGCGLREEALKLREHVTHVEYRVDGTPPAWDDFPGGDSG